MYGLYAPYPLWSSPSREHIISPISFEGGDMALLLCFNISIRLSWLQHEPSNIMDTRHRVNECLERNPAVKPRLWSRKVKPLRIVVEKSLASGIVYK